MLSRLLARITAPDKGQKYPDQQAEALGRVGDYMIYSPYGVYCDAPNDALGVVLKNGILAPITILRPSDLAQGEPVFYHPETNTRIIPRNDGSLDIIAAGKAVNIQCGDANIQCADANITADNDVVVNAGNNADITAANNANVVATTGINMTTPLVTVNGSLTVTGVITGASLVISGSGNIAGFDFASHVHFGSPTAPVGPVSNTGTVA